MTSWVKPFISQSFMFIDIGGGDDKSVEVTLGVCL